MTLDEFASWHVKTGTKFSVSQSLSGYLKAHLGLSYVVLHNYIVT